jgi:hypothetical protein
MAAVGTQIRVVRECAKDMRKIEKVNIIIITPRIKESPPREHMESLVESLTVKPSVRALAYRITQLTPLP